MSDKYTPGSSYPTFRLGSKIPTPRIPSPGGDPKVRGPAPDAPVPRLRRVYTNTYLRNVTNTLVNHILNGLACPLDRERVFAHRRGPALPERVVPIDQQLQM